MKVGAFGRNLRPLLVTLLAPSSISCNLIRVLALSGAIGLFYLYFGSFGVETGAASYEDWANALVNGDDLTHNAALQWRDIGFSLVLLLSGFSFTHSFIGFAIVQVLMAITIPGLIYLSLRPWFPIGSFYIAIGSTLTLAPFLMFKDVHHDQSYIFFQMLTVFIASSYVATTQSSKLYWTTLSAFAMSLMRMVGKYIFPVFLLAIYVQARGKIRHYVACLVLFTACATAYTAYRNSVLGDPPPILGQQVFYNVYLNSADYGVKITPDIGPATRAVLERTYQSFLPSPAKSAIYKDGPSPPEFMAEHFYNYSADELLAKVTSEPNWEYYLVFLSANDDRSLLLMSFEIAKRYPLYIAGMTLRNAWRLLYDPGWSHSRYTTKPLGREGLHFPLQGATTAQMYNVGDRVPEPALDEATYRPLASAFRVVRDFYYLEERLWELQYHRVTQVIFCFMMVSWISTGLGLLRRCFHHKRLLRWSKLWLSERVIAATLGISTLLLVNVGLTALLVDPLYRYDFSLLLLKMMLAGVGCVVSINLLGYWAANLPVHRRPLIFDEWRWSQKVTGEQNPVRYEAPPEGSTSMLRCPRPAAIAVSLCLAVVVCGGIAAWAWNLVNVAIAVPANGSIHVTSATFGSTCGTAPDTALEFVRSACSGKRQCDYRYDSRDVGKPPESCKDLRVEWSCSSGGAKMTRALPETPVRGDLIRLACP